jgi:lipopolysaccharide export system protein LptA
MYPKIFFLLLLLSPMATMALSSDRTKPLEIEADHVMIDDKQGKMIYTGNARFTQGSMEVTADKVEIYTVKRQFSHAVARGQPVKFQQKMDDGKTVKARAKRMEYRMKQQKLILEESAELWQDQNHIKSDRITYLLDKQQLDAKSQETGTDGRVRITIQPESIQAPAE